MFSANENLMLRQHKRRIVDRIEQTMPEEALDMGTTVMVMQVSCKDPGCVPLETAIIIVFPKCGDEELVPGLPESVGGSYKTKILKPMTDVTEDDILDNLPPQFEGGRRTMEKVCLYARDVMLAQITQLFGDGSDDANDGGSALKDRTAMALYLKACLDDYIAGGCKPPGFGEPMEGLASISQQNGDATLPSDPIETKTKQSSNDTPATTTSPSSTTTTSIPTEGNVVIRRKTQTQSSGSLRTGSTTTSIRARQPPQHERAIQQALGSQSGMGSSGSTMAISTLFQREHAPGIRKPGCPCCDPDDPARLADSFMMM